MARHRGRQGEWPTVKGNPEARFLTGDGFLNSDRDVAGPLRMGTAPGAGPKGEAVIADYTRTTDYGTDMVARDRKVDRKFPSDLIAREIRGPGPESQQPNTSDDKRKPK